MPPDPSCEAAQLALSVARDEDAPLDPDTWSHVSNCVVCSEFADGLSDLDDALGGRRFDLAPDVAGRVMAELGRPVRRWWTAAAVAVVGLTVGALVGGVGAQLEQVEARDLGELFHRASSSLEGFTAELTVVERGWHPEVAERIYVGDLAFAAPESLSVRITDRTRYPGPLWRHNDVEVTIDGGDLVSVASSRCPVAALPACQRPPQVRALTDRVPFEGSPFPALAFAGAGPESSSWGGVEVVGYPRLDGRETIQISTTVGGLDMISALVSTGAWRELYPTDPVLAWLDAETLVPLRVEVTPAASPERDLWALRRGYRDEPETDPILIVALSQFTTGRPRIELDVPSDARSGGFFESSSPTPEVELPEGFQPHRSGRWTLPEGGEVRVSTWSNGRSWLMVEATEAWAEPHLFGVSTSLVRRLDLGGGSVGYMDPTGGTVAVRGAGLDVVVTGSVSPTTLVAVASSMGIVGEALPDGWEQVAVADGGLPVEALAPTAEGWQVLGTTEEERVRILVVGSGGRVALIEQRRGARLEPPSGPDPLAVETRGTTGRFDPGSSTLEWVEEGWVIRMRGDGIGLAEMLALAESMERG